MMKRVLVIEDNVRLSKVLSDNLRFDGFEVRCVHDGRLAIDEAQDYLPDLVVLDIMLPGKSGFELCSELRRRRGTAILILTALGGNDDRVRGLNLGADDYVTKPFDMKELLARAHAILRRTRPQVESITLGAVMIDFQSSRAWNAQHSIELTQLELALLRYLAEREGLIVDRDELLREVWGYSSLPHTRSVDAAITRIRRKIEPMPHRPRFVHSVYGTGYRLTTHAAGT